LIVALQLDATSPGMAKEKFAIVASIATPSVAEISPTSAVLVIVVVIWVSSDSIADIRNGNCH
jgi:hypothetical protein